MIKQIKSSEIKKFIDKNPNTILLDVRTEDEWNSFIELEFATPHGFQYYIGGKLYNYSPRVLNWHDPYEPVTFAAWFWC